jgi:hypothetical protein
MITEMFNDEDPTGDYSYKTFARFRKLMTATQEMVVYFMEAGDDVLTAKEKVSELSVSLAPYLMLFIMGNKVPVIDLINASELTYMTEQVKADLIIMLTDHE